MLGFFFGLNDRQLRKILLLKPKVALSAADLSKQLADQQAFMAQKDQPGGKKTLKAYYWYICGQEYDAQHS